MTGFFSRFIQRSLAADTARIAGAPTSSNKASSFHLNWDIAQAPLAEVRATIDVIEPPIIDKLYFWALQTSFMGPNGRIGEPISACSITPAIPTVVR